MTHQSPSCSHVWVITRHSGAGAGVFHGQVTQGSLGICKMAFWTLRTIPVKSLTAVLIIAACGNQLILTGKTLHKKKSLCWLSQESWLK